MSGTYKAIGINLKSSPLGESDRLLTVLTDEYGLLRIAAPGARKHKSSLGGRSSLFVINQLLIAKGRSLDKIIQAESIESFPALSQDLSKLTAAQYLAELTLFQALSDHPQTELLCLLREHLGRIAALPVVPTAALAAAPATVTLACLTHAMFQLLALAGLTPQLYTCCLTQQQIGPDALEPIGFSVVGGGLVRIEQIEHRPLPPPRLKAAASTGSYQTQSNQGQSDQGKHQGKQTTNQDNQTSAEPLSLSRNALPKSPDLLVPLSAIDLRLLQQLTQPDLIQALAKDNSDLLQLSHQQSWLTLERVLRQYAQYHFDRPIRSAALIDVCFTDPLQSSSAVSTDPFTAPLRPLMPSPLHKS
jgi:DNA repair protein RecO (recombination protein O)